MVAAMIVVFAIAAIAGITLAGMHFSNKSLPMWIAVIHGLLAVSGVLLLIISLAKLAAAGVLGVALVFFILAALGGLALFFGFYLQKKRLSSPIVALHALFAVIGFVLVIVYTASH